MVSFRILGPLEIVTPIRTFGIKGTLQRTLLLALLINAGRMVAKEALIDELWGANPPTEVENALQANVSRLRRRLAVLEPDAQTCRLAVSPSDGYRLIVKDDELDAAKFLRGLEQVRCQANDAPAAACRQIRRLLELWRGPVLGGVTGGYMCRAAAARYEESRLAALELLFDYELRAGEHRRIIPELRELLHEHPHKEHFRQQLMIALYRSGRQADALKAYRELRDVLMDELGLEPSPGTRDYERAILQQDPRLELSPRPEMAGG